MFFFFSSECAKGADTDTSRYPSKAEVARINDARLDALTTPLQQYSSADSPGVDSKGYTLTPGQATEVLNRNTIWPQHLHVKKGAMVMLVTVSALRSLS